MRRGLLFAGTERAVYVSFDDGDALAAAPAQHAGTSIRDLVIHGRRHRGRHARPLVLDPRRHRRRCASSTPRPRRRGVSVRARAPPTACAATRTPIRRCRPKSPPARIRPTARSSTTICAGRAAGRDAGDPRRAAARSSAAFERPTPRRAVDSELTCRRTGAAARAALGRRRACTASCGTCTIRRRTRSSTTIRSRPSCTTRRAIR